MPVNAFLDDGPVRRILEKCDAEGYSHLHTDDQRELQHKLVDVQVRAARNAHLERAKAYVQTAGDGNLTAWPPGTKEVDLVAVYLREFGTELAQVNKRRTTDSQIRVRLAVATGLCEIGELGLAGQGPVTVAGRGDRKKA